LITALVGGEWSASRPDCFTPGERALGTHWIGDWVDPKVGLDDVEKKKFLTLPGPELRLLGRAACNQSQYRLRYNSYNIIIFTDTTMGTSYVTSNIHSKVGILPQKSKVKISLLHAIEAPRVARGRGSHIT
jgi:hypothetical protein